MYNQGETMIEDSGDMKPSKPVIDDKGRAWKEFLLDWTSDGKEYSVTISAISYEHALLIVEDMRETMRIGGELLGTMDGPDKYNMPGPDNPNWGGK
jgi:hypothetical protein